MKRALAVAGATGLVFALGVGPAEAAKPTCNWGQLTSDSIADGFDQGGHASQPPIEAKRRSGLANVVAKGDLDATCTLIAGL